jgi:hypothetical protein
MCAATAWDDGARGSTVMGTLRERQRRHYKEATDARRRIAERQEGPSPTMTVAGMEQAWEDFIKARWHGGPNVLAFLFAQPDSDAIRMLDARGVYFDQRTGDTWDLFFPGYYRSPKVRHFEQQSGARPVGRDYAADWYFNARDLNALREHIERCSERRWEYSGGTDLVLINGWMVERGEPTIDWASTISGQLTDQAVGARTLTLGEVIERITRDLHNAIEDPSYGVGVVTGDPPPPEGHVVRGFVLNALAEIVAALTVRAMDG